MGNCPRCCKNPCDSCIGKAEVPQIVMLGQEGAGKTTLLYKLKLPRWKADEMIKDIGKLRPKKMTDDTSSSGDGQHLMQIRPLDPGYHYEEIDIVKFGRFGIWDVPGNEAMVRMWPLFYRYIKTIACFYVVDASAEGKESAKNLAQGRRQIRFLLNEDELRAAAFVLICNVRTREGADAKEDEFVDTVKRELGVPDILSQPAQKARFMSFTMNMREEDDKFAKKWADLMKQIQSVMLANPTI